MKKALKTIGNVIVWIFVVIAVIVTIAVFSSTLNENGLPNLFGKSFITLQTGSMEPTLKQGTTIVSNVYDSSKTVLKEGDIITFHSPDDINGDGETGDLDTHRIKFVYADAGDGYTYYLTQGDNALNTDVDQYYIDGGVKTYLTKDSPASVYMRYGLRNSDIVAVYANVNLGTAIGSVANFLKQPLYFGLCIVVPLILFFLYELISFILIVFRLKQAKQGATVGGSGLTEEEIKRQAIEEYKRQMQEEAEKQANNNKD